MISLNGVLQYLPPEIVLKTIFPYLNAVDLMNLSKTNRWWKEKVKTYLVDFVLSSVEFNNSKAPVGLIKVMKSLETLDTDFIIDDLFPLLKFYHLKSFQKINIFWNRNVKMFMEKIKINPQNISSYWQEREEEDWEVLFYLNSKHFERLTSNLHFQAQVQVMDRKFGKYPDHLHFLASKYKRGLNYINFKKREQNPNTQDLVSGVKTANWKTEEGTEMLDIDDREVLNY